MLRTLSFVCDCLALAKSLLKDGKEPLCDDPRQAAVLDEGDLVKHLRFDGRWLNTANYEIVV